jgi:hypothetical protein
MDVPVAIKYDHQTGLFPVRKSWHPDVLECILQAVALHMNEKIGKNVNNGVVVKNLSFAAVLQGIHQTTGLDAVVEHHHVLPKTDTANWFEKEPAGRIKLGRLPTRRRARRTFKTFVAYTLTWPGGA